MSFVTIVRPIARAVAVRPLIAVAIALAPAVVAAQGATRANADRITPIATSGCSGASWSQLRTAEGAGYPVIIQVDDYSPADRSGLKDGDIVLAVNDRDARHLDSWFIAAPGQVVKVRIQRGTKVRDVELTAGRVNELAPEKYAVQCLGETARR